MPIIRLSVYKILRLSLQAEFRQPCHWHYRARSRMSVCCGSDKFETGPPRSPTVKIRGGKEGLLQYQVPKHAEGTTRDIRSGCRSLVERGNRVPIGAVS